VESMDAREILDHIRRQPRGRTDLKHLSRQLGAKGERRAALRRLLDGLVTEGSIVEYRPAHYAVPSAGSEFVSGRLSLHRDGYGFVIPDQPVPKAQGDIYIGSRSTGDAMNGDRVLVRIASISNEGRAEGRVQRILKHTHETIVGQFHFSQRGHYVTPHDERLRHTVLIESGNAIPPPEAIGERLGNVRPPKVDRVEDLDGLIVNVELTEFPTRLTPARGRVIEVLGKPGDFGVDVEVIIRKFHLPHQFPAPVKKEVERIEEAISGSEIENRRDFRQFEIVTIDGETARDFDDAVWVERLENGHFALHVHIADVSHYVQPGTAIDQEARLRGTSVYFPDRAVPMLPTELSTGICSLNPSVDRLVLSALLEIDNDGTTVKAEFCEGVIRSVERMTYTNVNKILEDDPEQSKRYHALVPRFRLMKELALILNRRREKRGSIDFDLPEAVFEFDDLGMMTGVARLERNIAHRLIEEFMLAANEAVAHHLESLGVPSLFRVHELPEPKRLLDFQEVASAFGYSLGVDIPVRQITTTQRGRDGSRSRRQTAVPQGDVKISSRHYQKLIKKLEGKPEERILSYLMLRSLKQARYSEVNYGHFALAAPSYTHFTSPIRRYPDLIVHRILRAVLGTAPRSPYQGSGVKGPLTEDQLEQIAVETSQTERRAADAERALIDWKKARFIEERLGDEFEAIVIQVMRGGMFVELVDLFIEGFVPVDSFTDGRYQYREDQRLLMNTKSKQKFAIGDRLRVRADRVGYLEMKPEFSWVPGETAKKKKAKQK
jgi:ribonuclease R